MQRGALVRDVNQSRRLAWQTELRLCRLSGINGVRKQELPSAMAARLREKPRYCAYVVDGRSHLPASSQGGRTDNC